MSSIPVNPVPDDNSASSSSVTPIKPATEPAPSATFEQSRFPAEQLILQRDLNEVLLLLDFISGRPDVHIWDIGDIKYPVRQSTEANANAENGNRGTSPPSVLPPIEVIRRICALRYPPEPNQSLNDRADDAALLLCVKDKVNSIAYPANGVTIAYTYMFLEERSRAKRNSPAPLENGVTLDRETRAVVARSAYPGLIPSAKRFRCFHRNVSRVGAAVTFFSAILLWLVVYGLQLTSRFEDDQKSTADLTSQIYAAVDKENSSLAPDKQKHDSVPVRCDSKIDQQSSQIRLLCNRWSYYQARYEKSINDAAAFAERSPSSWLTMPFPISSMLLTKNKGGNTVAAQENIQSITLVLSAYASYVLPVLFGLVGTIASFLRDISDRITRSILAPRDETLAIIRLILGAIAGLAVGLFFTPASVAQTVSSGSGALTLSASGIAFIAGYGADGFFRMIDAMIVRVFSLDRPDKPVQAK